MTQIYLTTPNYNQTYGEQVNDLKRQFHQQISINELTLTDAEYNRLAEDINTNTAYLSRVYAGRGYAITASINYIKSAFEGWLNKEVDAKREIARCGHPV